MRVWCAWGCFAEFADKGGRSRSGAGKLLALRTKVGEGRLEKESCKDEVGDGPGEVRLELEGAKLYRRDLRVVALSRVEEGTNVLSLVKAKAPTWRGYVCYNGKVWWGSQTLPGPRLRVGTYQYSP